eukprot:6335251-Pyramimonas_sp.AAC.1
MMLWIQRGKYTFDLLGEDLSLDLGGALVGGHVALALHSHGVGGRECLPLLRADLETADDL